MPPLRLHSFCADELLVIHNPGAGCSRRHRRAGRIGYSEQDTDQPPNSISRNGTQIAYGVGLTVDEAVAHVRWLADQVSYQDAEAEWFAVTSLLPTNPLVRRESSTPS
ncbi:MAG: hypothetical protein U0521_26250 [Anaerolineae bacterium]